MTKEGNSLDSKNNKDAGFRLHPFCSTYSRTGTPNVGKASGRKAGCLLHVVLQATRIVRIPPSGRRIGTFVLAALLAIAYGGLIELLQEALGAGRHVYVFGLVEDTVRLLGYGLLRRCGSAHPRYMECSVLGVSTVANALSTMADWSGPAWSTRDRNASSAWAKCFFIG